MGCSCSSLDIEDDSLAKVAISLTSMTRSEQLHSGSDKAHDDNSVLSSPLEHITLKFELIQLVFSSLILSVLARTITLNNVYNS